MKPVFVTYVNFVLSKKEHYTLDYGTIRQELAGYPSVNLATLRRVIIDIRESKLPDPKVLGNAGSFFMNPIVPRAQFEALLDLYPAMPHYEVDAGRVKPISEHLIGIFFEDINYGADGGLYAELVQNRDFEYSAKDGARDKNWNSTYAWSIQGTDAELSVSEDSPIHANNAHYAVLEVHRPGAALVNNGFDGIAVKKR